MRLHLRPRCALVGCALIACLTTLAGCGQPVREDRSINWSKEGESVGFQHGQEGIFLADKDGGKVNRIFQPSPEVVATSPPLWSPSGKRVLFTTARSVSGQPSVNLPFVSNDQDPAGNVHLQHDIEYTCWLYEQTGDGLPATPRALFKATADHPGYVAANLAVRWHPRLDQVNYIKKVAAHQHGLFEYDLGSKQSRQILPHTSEAVLFDWTPDGSHLVCLLGSIQRTGTDGIWIGQPDQADWWHVPHSGELACGEFGSLLENLRATRPACTGDGSRLAFPSFVPGPTSEQPGRHFLRHAVLATHAMGIWVEGDQPFRDLRWDKEGLRLGVVRGGEKGSLHLVRQGQPLSPKVNEAPVRRFAGWSEDNKRLAYVAPDDLPPASEEPWALLLIADNLARDKVYVAAGEGTEPGRSVFSGMRVTFPQWSPREDKLSLWVTFMPTYRSVVSHLFGWGLRPGDPAAVLDMESGQLGWMPVNAQEKVQIGHYSLLKHDYAKAWQWYEEAEHELPQPQPTGVRQFTDYLRAIQGPRDFSLFQYHCLTKLGRPEEARAKLDQFRRQFLPTSVEPFNGQRSPAGVTVDGKTLERQLQDLLAGDTFIGSLLRDMYAAEVYMSLDAPADGEAYFRAVLDQADTEAARLSRAVALGQILLLEGKYRQYADLATQTIAPLLIKAVKPVSAGERRDFLEANILTQFVGSLALLPLGASEFLALQSDEQLKNILVQWEKLHAGANDESRTLIDLVLHGLYKGLGREKERQETALRLKNRPGESLMPAVDGESGKAIVALHAQMRDLLRR
jgi:hypothetical protein